MTSEQELWLSRGFDMAWTALRSELLGTILSEDPECKRKAKAKMIALVKFGTNGAADAEQAYRDHIERVLMAEK